MVRKSTCESYIRVKLSKILIDELKSYCLKNDYQTLQNCLEELIITEIIKQ